VAKTLPFKCQKCGVQSEGRADRVASGRTKYCSRACSGAVSSRNQAGSANPNWKGGISEDYYHYKKIQKLRYPERLKARSAVHYALKAGNLERQPCEICGKTEVEAHHEDYSEPLQVRWLCRHHHREIHIEETRNVL